MTARKALLWAPRVLGILFAIFVSVFALDVFSEDYQVWETILALVMHMVPTLLVVVALVIAWRWAGVGAILFVALALAYMLMSRGQGWLLTAPLLVIGGLFAASWRFSGGELVEFAAS